MIRRASSLLLAMALLAACGSDATVPVPDTVPPASTTTTPPTTIVVDHLGNLVSAKWAVTGVIYGDIVEPPPDGADVHLTFRIDGTVSGSLGCNHLSGDWTPGATTVSVGNLAVTEMACSDATDWLEVLDYLVGDLTVHGPDANFVTLASDVGQILLEPHGNQLEADQPADNPDDSVSVVNLADESARQQLIGMTEADAEKAVVAFGWVFRVDHRDGEDLMLTADYVEHRINASIVDGLVVRVGVG